MTDYKWEVGQRVHLTPHYGHETIEMIERVTPSGRAVIGCDQYGKDGFKIGCKSGNGFSRHVIIQPLTPQLEEGVERQRLRRAFARGSIVIARAIPTPRLRELAAQHKAILDELEGITTKTKGDAE